MYRLLHHPKTEKTSFDPKTTATDVPVEFIQEAVFAGGSFWELEAQFGRVDGVMKSATGYCGGTLKKPTYKDVKNVSQANTGHTEAVKVSFDSRKVSFKSLCRVFFTNHDPTNKEYLRFGIDTHYRSAIFYVNDEQNKQAHQVKIQHQMKLNKRIVTQILSCPSDFYLAENCHQKYYLQKDYIRLCESLNLRSTQRFADSNVACKLNGIFGCEEKLIAGSIDKFMETYDFPDGTKLILEGIIAELRRINFV